ncbi:MAG TPA: alpha/beta hydrolase-fold protein, partial [Jiangellaceae bacterium]
GDIVVRVTGTRHDEPTYQVHQPLPNTQEVPITTPTVSGKPGQAPTGLSCDLYPLISSHSTWTDPRGPVSTGEMRAAIVLDNLVHRGEMPVTLGVFVDPGRPGNRNLEYDAFDDRYANFLLTEIIPEVENRFAVANDPDQWAICGGSSGGNCALTVAWHRPDRFRRIVSFLGSFAQMPGGNPYPAAIRDEPAKPLRIFMQAGTRDLNWNEPERNWFSNNLKVAAALAEAGYDHRLVLGDGGHSPNHGGVLLPDALRWIWRTATTDERP